MQELPAKSADHPRDIGCCYRFQRLASNNDHRLSQYSGENLLGAQIEAGVHDVVTTPFQDQDSEVVVKLMVGLIGR